MAASFFGLDIGRYYIKVVDAEYSGRNRILKSAGVFSSQSGGIQLESPADLKNLSESIRKGVKSLRINSDKCVVSLMESQIVSRMIKMPVLSDKELGAAINYEAEQYIPLPLKDVVLQYKILNRPKGASSASKMDVFLVAAPKRIVEKYLKVVKDAGFTVLALETESTALVRSLVLAQDPPTIIVSLGAVTTELVVSVFGNVFFTRSVSVGGANITKSLMDEFRLPAAQAEEYKRAYGVLKDKVSGKVALVIRPHLEIIASEITRAGEFTRSRIPDVQVRRVIITGGGAFLPGLGEFLVDATGLEVMMGDPFRYFKKDKLVNSFSGQGSIYSIATGLALRT